MMMPFKSNAFNLADWGTDATKVRTLAAGKIYGFQIEADPRNRGAYPLKLVLRDGDKQGEDYLYVTSNQYHHCRNNPLSFVGIVIDGTENKAEGNWFINYASVPEMVIYPSPPPIALADLPAVMGGIAKQLTTVPTQEAWQRFTYNPPVPNGPAPASPTAGQALGTASTMWVYVSAQGGATITSGGLDIWRFDGEDAVWVKVLENIAIPTGVQFAGMPVDLTEYRGPDDRWIAVPKDLVVSAGTSVRIFQRLA